MITLSPQPTEEQQAIIDAAANGMNLVVQAGADTGRTTTLQYIVAAVLKPTVYVAFNKTTADEARSKFAPHVRSSTIQALAFNAIGKRHARRLNGPRLPGRASAVDDLVMDLATLSGEDAFAAPAPVALGIVDRGAG